MPAPSPPLPDDFHDIPLEKWAFGMRMIDVVFVREFLIDLNIYAAMVRTGYTPETARAQGHRHLKRPVILRAIANAMEDRAEALRITAKTVLGEAFRCYLAAAGDKSWTAAAKFLELAGRHVDVRAFRDRLAPDGSIPDATDADEALARLDDKDLAELQRLHAKMAGGNAPTSPSVN